MGVCTWRASVPLAATLLTTSRSAEDPELARAGSRLRSSRRSKLAANVGHVSFDRAEGDVQFCRNLLVWPAHREQAPHFHLTLAQRLHQRRYAVRRGALVSCAARGRYLKRACEPSSTGRRYGGPARIASVSLRCHQLPISVAIGAPSSANRRTQSSRLANPIASATAARAAAP